MQCRLSRGRFSRGCGDFGGCGEKKGRIGFGRPSVLESEKVMLSLHARSLRDS